MEKRKLTVASFRKMKANKEKIVMVTAYDAPGAGIAAAAGVEILLVGDSLAMTALGYENTLPLTLEESLHHAAAVRRGAPDAFVVGDMPFLSYQLDMNEAVRNAGRYIKEAHCNAVKLEGGSEIVPLVEKMVKTGIPVMAHVGLMPQHIATAGGYRIAGRTEDEAERLLNEVKAFENAGAFRSMQSGLKTKMCRIWDWQWDTAFGTLLLIFQYIMRVLQFMFPNHYNIMELQK